MSRQANFNTVLDAPSLRDDYYCSILAYSVKAKVLAVGLANTVYFWNESGGVDSPTSLNPPSNAHVSSLSFSSNQGEKAILAVGRSNGQVMLYSPLEAEPRFDSAQSSPICCVAFRPTTAKKPSQRDHHILVDTEELLVGDEIGNVLIYSVEWPTPMERNLFNWIGCFSLMARITIHTQQVCRLAWSPDGESFATGGNDNTCHLFDTKKIIQIPNQGMQNHVQLSAPNFNLSALFAKHSFSVAAAVKAIAFCPWQRGLLAIGGGSNDRQVHFYHTLSGAALATIDCHSQITSLV
jgi:WD40 repeat protein